MDSEILLVDDDRALLKLLASSLQHYGFKVNPCETGVDALRMIHEQPPALIISDIKLPGMSGIDLCRRLRSLIDVPILILSGLHQEEMIVAGLEAGADDYITKPYRLIELVARIRAHLRAHKTAKGTTTVAQAMTGENLSIDMNHRKVTVRGKDVELTPTEYALLLFLAHNRNQAVDHGTLLAEVWGQEYVGQLTYLRLYIRYLRLKIEEYPCDPKIIKTERGIGYYLVL